MLQELRGTTPPHWIRKLMMKPGPVKNKLTGLLTLTRLKCDLKPAADSQSERQLYHTIVVLSAQMKVQLTEEFPAH